MISWFFLEYVIQINDFISQVKSHFFQVSNSTDASKKYKYVIFDKWDINIEIIFSCVCSWWNLFCVDIEYFVYLWLENVTELNHWSQWQLLILAQNFESCSCWNNINEYINDKIIIITVNLNSRITAFSK